MSKFFFVLSVSLIVGFLSLFSPQNIFAQQSFPQGGSDFASAIQIMPGQYQGGQLSWEEGSNQDVYSFNGIKGGQAIQTKVKFSGNTNIELSLYDSNKNKLTYVMGGGDDTDTLVWLTNSAKNTGTYYLVVKNAAIEEATNISLDVSVINDFDAGSQTDAGDIITQALSIVPGNYQGYLSGDQGNDEADFYSLNLKKGKVTSVKITPPAEDSFSVALYDTNRTLLDQKISDNNGAITALSFTPANDGTYYLKVVCESGCNKVVNYQMQIVGEVLPTGGGLMPTGSTTVQETNPSIVPSTNTMQTSAFKPSMRDYLFIALIVITIIIIIVITVIIINKKSSEKGKSEKDTEEKADHSETSKDTTKHKTV